MKLNEFTEYELKEYKKALKLLLERYEDDKWILCPLCPIAGGIAGIMEDSPDYRVQCTLYIEQYKGCNYCIWSSYYDDIEERKDFLCSAVYGNKFKEFYEFRTLSIDVKMKNYRIKEIKQWIKDIERELVDEIHAERMTKGEI